jgi:hypothetical protein
MPAPSDQRDDSRATHDPVNFPAHYRSHPSGVECIEITEHHNFCIGNALKYLWRCDEKGDALENLAKARWYIDREIDRRRRISGLAGSAPRPVGGAS